MRVTHLVVHILVAFCSGGRQSAATKDRRGNRYRHGAAATLHHQPRCCNAEGELLYLLPAVFQRRSTKSDRCHRLHLQRFGQCILSAVFKQLSFKICSQVPLIMFPLLAFKTFPVNSLECTGVARLHGLALQYIIFCNRRQVPVLHPRVFLKLVLVLDFILGYSYWSRSLTLRSAPTPKMDMLSQAHTSVEDIGRTYVH